MGHMITQNFIYKKKKEKRRRIFKLKADACSVKMERRKKDQTIWTVDLIMRSDDMNSRADARVLLFFLKK